jgi:hypothetical protein
MGRALERSQGLGQKMPAVVSKSSSIGNLVIHACSTDLPDGIPKREEIMALIDLDPNAIDRMAKVIALAPHVFPAIKEWTR